MRNSAQPEDSGDIVERLSALDEFERWTERPMQVLGFGWLALLIIELTRGLSPLLAGLSTAIWIVFAIDFAVRLFLAPAKVAYLKRNWLVAFSLLVPARRILRIARGVRLLRAAPAVRGFRFVRVIGSLNRGMTALGRSLSRRGLGYVAALTVIVTLVGAAGMHAFERSPAGASGFADYPSSLWWTAMIMTTLGTSDWPQTAEGRALCLILALYGFAVWGYLTASLATYFVGQGVGLMNKVKPAREVVREFIEDYLAATERLSNSLPD